MTIESGAFLDEELIPMKFTCDGEDINPPLGIDGVPVSAQSLALILDDPDAPNGSFHHWVIWNLSPELRYILEGKPPEPSTIGTNSTDQLGYVGPCPPTGTHRYQFKVYALDEVLELEQGATAEELESAMEGHILEQAVLTGTYTSA